MVGTNLDIRTSCKCLHVCFPAPCVFALFAVACRLPLIRLHLRWSLRVPFRTSSPRHATRLSWTILNRSRFPLGPFVSLLFSLWGALLSRRPIFFALSALSARGHGIRGPALHLPGGGWGGQGARSKKDGGGLLNSDQRNPLRPEKKTKTPSVPKTCLSPPLGNVCIRQDTAESESNPVGMNMIDPKPGTDVFKGGEGAFRARSIPSHLPESNLSKRPKIEISNSFGYPSFGGWTPKASQTEDHSNRRLPRFSFC